MGLATSSAAAVKPPAAEPVVRMTSRATDHAASAMLNTDTRNRERPGAVEHIDLRRQHAEQVRQRQPHAADLLPAGHQAVEDSPRHDQVGAGIVVAEGEPKVRVVESGGAPGEEHARGSEQCGRRASRGQGATSLHFEG